MVALEIVQAEPERREQLWRCSEILRAELARFELPVVADSEGPILPILTEDPTTTLAAAQTLERQSYLVSAIRPPTVPHGTSRLRISISTAFNEIDIRALAIAVARAVGEQAMVKQAEEQKQRRS